jgi:hypothetical protein
MVKRDFSLKIIAPSPLISEFFNVWVIAEGIILHKVYDAEVKSCKAAESYFSSRLLFLKRILGMEEPSFKLFFPMPVLSVLFSHHHFLCSGFLDGVPLFLFLRSAASFISALVFNDSVGTVG